MPLDQHELPALSASLWNFADAVRQVEMPRIRRLWISGIAPDSDNILRWMRTQDDENALSDLAILAALRDLESYRAPTEENTRRNLSTVARVGGTALRHLFDIAIGKHVVLSDRAMHGVAGVASGIKDRLSEEFELIAGGGRMDDPARQYLVRASRIIGDSGRREARIVTIDGGKFHGSRNAF